MLKKFPLDKINVTKYALFFVCVSPKSSQFYFYFGILMQAEAQGSSLLTYVWDFSFLIPSRFY